MYFNFPFKIDSKGSVAITNEEDHIRQLIEQVLFTNPGERLNHPPFGAGINQLLFTAASEEMVTAAQFTIQNSLIQWLGDLIKVEFIQVRNIGSVKLSSKSYS